MRNARDVHALEAELSRVQEQVFVTGDVFAPQPSAYHALLHHLAARLWRVDIRWRWIVLRLWSMLMVIAASALTYATLRAVRSRMASALGVALVALGPASAWGAATIDPSATVAALWAGWVYAIARLFRGSPWGGVWASLVGLAMSAIEVQGAAACGATIVAVAVGWSVFGRGVGRVAGLIALACGLVATGLWTLRFATGSVANSALAWRAYLFGVPNELHAMPVALAVGWAVLGACVLASSVAAVMPPTREALVLATAAVLSAGASAAGLSTTTILAVSPVLASLVASSALLRQDRGLITAAATSALALVNWAALVAWVLPSLYQ